MIIPQTVKLICGCKEIKKEGKPVKFLLPFMDAFPDKDGNRFVGNAFNDVPIPPNTYCSLIFNQSGFVAACVPLSEADLKDLGIKK